MSGIIDLSELRAAKEGPDADCMRKDQFGRPMGLFALEYEMDDRHWSAEVWAYSHQDAENRVKAMRDSLVCRGQIVSIIPA